jgi:hypothetical protein
MPDRRRIGRKYLMFYSRVFDVQTTKLIGHLVDITPEGAMLISETPVPAGQDFHLKMELSPDVADIPYLEFEARSLWCQQDINPQFYNSGFKFVSIAPESIAIVEKIVEAYGFRDN